MMFGMSFSSASIYVSSLLGVNSPPFLRSSKLTMLVSTKTSGEYKIFIVSLLEHSSQFCSNGLMLPWLIASCRLLTPYKLSSCASVSKTGKFFMVTIFLQSLLLQLIRSE